MRASVRATAFHAWWRHSRPSQQSIGVQPEDHMRESKVRKTAAKLTYERQGKWQAASLSKPNYGCTMYVRERSFYADNRQNTSHQPSRQ